MHIRLFLLPIKFSTNFESSRRFRILYNRPIIITCSYFRYRNQIKIVIAYPYISCNWFTSEKKCIYLLLYAATIAYNSTRLLDSLIPCSLQIIQLVLVDSCTNRIIKIFCILTIYAYI